MNFMYSPHLRTSLLTHMPIEKGVPDDFFSSYPSKVSPTALTHTVDNNIAHSYNHSNAPTAMNFNRIKTECPPKNDSKLMGNNQMHAASIRTSYMKFPEPADTNGSTQQATKPNFSNTFSSTPMHMSITNDSRRTLNQNSQTGMPGSSVAPTFKNSNIVGSPLTHLLMTEPCSQQRPIDVQFQMAKLVPSKQDAPHGMTSVSSCAAPMQCVGQQGQAYSGHRMSDSSFQRHDSNHFLGLQHQNGMNGNAQLNQRMSDFFLNKTICGSNNSSTLHKLPSKSMNLNAPGKIVISHPPTTADVSPFSKVSSGTTQLNSPQQRTESMNATSSSNVAFSNLNGGVWLNSLGKMPSSSNMDITANTGIGMSAQSPKLFNANTLSVASNHINSDSSLVADDSSPLCGMPAVTHVVSAGMPVNGRGRDSTMGAHLPFTPSLASDTVSVLESKKRSASSMSNNFVQSAPPLSKRQVLRKEPKVVPRFARINTPPKTTMLYMPPQSLATASSSPPTPHQTPSFLPPHCTNDVLRFNALRQSQPFPFVLQPSRASNVSRSNDIGFPVSQAPSLSDDAPTFRNEHQLDGQRSQVTPCYSPGAQLMHPHPYKQLNTFRSNPKPIQLMQKQTQNQLVEQPKNRNAQNTIITGKAMNQVAQPNQINTNLHSSLWIPLSQDTPHQKLPQSKNSMQAQSTLVHGNCSLPSHNVNLLSSRKSLVSSNLPQYMNQEKLNSTPLASAVQNGSAANRIEFRFPNSETHSAARSGISGPVTNDCNSLIFINSSTMANQLGEKKSTSELDASQNGSALRSLDVSQASSMNSKPQLLQNATGKFGKNLIIDPIENSVPQQKAHYFDNDQHMGQTSSFGASVTLRNQLGLQNNIMDNRIISAAHSSRQPRHSNTASSSDNPSHAVDKQNCNSILVPMTSASLSVDFPYSPIVRTPETPRQLLANHHTQTRTDMLPNKSEFLANTPLLMKNMHHARTAKNETTPAPYSRLRSDSVSMGKHSVGRFDTVKTDSNDAQRPMSLFYYLPSSGGQKNCVAANLALHNTDYTVPFQCQAHTQETAVAQQLNELGHCLVSSETAQYQSAVSCSSQSPSQSVSESTATCHNDTTNATFFTDISSHAVTLSTSTVPPTTANNENAIVSSTSTRSVDDSEKLRPDEEPIAALLNPPQSQLPTLSEVQKNEQTEKTNLFLQPSTVSSYNLIHNYSSLQDASLRFNTSADLKIDKKANTVQEQTICKGETVQSSASSTNSCISEKRDGSLEETNSTDSRVSDDQANDDTTLKNLDSNVSSKSLSNVRPELFTKTLSDELLVDLNYTSLWANSPLFLYDESSNTPSVNTVSDEAISLGLRFDKDVDDATTLFGQSDFYNNAFSLDKEVIMIASCSSSQDHYEPLDEYYSSIEPNFWSLDCQPLEHSLINYSSSLIGFSHEEEYDQLFDLPRFVDEEDVAVSPALPNAHNVLLF